MIQHSELLILILAATLAPIMVGMYRALDLAYRGWLAAGLIAMMSAFMATVIEGFFLGDLFNLVEHAAFATAGVCFAATAIGLLRDAVRAPGART